MAMLALRITLGGAAVGLGLVAGCSSFSTVAGPSTETVDASPADSGGPASEGGATDDGGTVGLLVLATGFARLVGVAATETTVYFTEQRTGLIHEVPIEGGDVVTPADADAGTPLGIGLRDGTAYWGDPTAGNLRQWTPDTAVVTWPTPAPAPFAVATNPTELFTLARSSPTSGSVQSRAYASPGMVASHVDNLAAPGDLAIGDNAVYVTETGKDQISVFSIVNGRLQTPAALVMMDETDCGYVTTTPGHVAWSAGARIREVMTGGSLPPITIAPDEGGISALGATNGDYVWLRSDGQLRRWRRVENRIENVGSPVAVVTLADARSLALTSKYAVVITADGRVLRITL